MLFGSSAIDCTCGGTARLFSFNAVSHDCGAAFSAQATSARCTALWYCVGSGFGMPTSSATDIGMSLIWRHKASSSATEMLPSEGAPCLARTLPSSALWVALVR